MDTCYNCGQRLTPSARFCAACGAPADSDQTGVSNDATRFASEETRVAQPRPRAVEPLPVRPLSSVPERRSDEREGDEQVVFTVRPTLLFVKIGYLLAALGGVALIALLAYLKVPLLFAIPLELALLSIPAYKSLKRKTVRFQLTDYKTVIVDGISSQMTHTIHTINNT